MEGKFNGEERDWERGCDTKNNKGVKNVEEKLISGGKGVGGVLTKVCLNRGVGEGIRVYASF